MALLKRLDEYFADNYELMYEASRLLEARAKKAELPVVELPDDLQVHDNYEQDDELKYINQGWRWLVTIAFPPWTQRLWIVQEQILSKRIVILYATSLLPWDAVAAIPSMFCLDSLPYCYVRRFWEEATLPISVLPMSIAESLYVLWHRQQALRKEKEIVQRTLLANMYTYEDLKCWILAIESLHCSQFLLTPRL